MHRNNFYSLFLAAAVLTIAAGAPVIDARVLNVDGVTTFRRAPLPAAGRGGGLAPLENGDFGDGLASWIANESGGSASPGSAAAENSAAVLREGDSFLVSLSQSFSLAPGARSLSFTLRLTPGFDRNDDFLPDAFEVSLLDASRRPVTGVWDEQATSFLNFQETGTVLQGPGVAWDGSRATLDVSAVPAGTEVVLYFDLIGADADFESAVEIDDIEVTAGKEGFIRGDPNSDGLLNITDPIVILNYLFLGTSTPHCLDAADTNDDSLLNITDPIYLLGFLFLGTSPMPPPFPECGFDAGPEDNLDCQPCSCPEIAGGNPCP